MKQYDGQKDLELEMQNLGKAVKNLRKAKGLSLKDFDCAAYIVAQVESGKTNVQVDTIHKIAYELGYTLAELFAISARVGSISF